MMTARDRAAFLLTVLLDRLDDRGDQVRVGDVLDIVDALVEAGREPVAAEALADEIGGVDADHWTLLDGRVRRRQAGR